MSQKSVITLTVYKIQGVNGNTTFDGGSTSSGSTQDVTLVMWGTSALITRIPSRSGSSSTYDAIIEVGDGRRLWTTQEFADLITALSSTDSTNS